MPSLQNGPPFRADPREVAPPDIRVREAARLYEVKREVNRGRLCRPGAREARGLPRNAASRAPELGFESVEDLDPSTVDRLAIVGPHIYTDGSKTEGKVGAALTEWRDEMESEPTFRLESFCTVFQAEMFALHRAIKRVKKGKDRLVNIFSDSKSSLQMLTAPKTYNPLAHAAPRHQGYRCGRQEVRLFWVRAHAEPRATSADELARNAALKRKRQRITIAIRRTPKGDQGGEPGRGPPAIHDHAPIAQTLTGHGGSAQYLNRFKLKDSPYACAPIRSKMYCTFSKNAQSSGESAETEAGTGVVVARHGFPALDDERNRKIF
ncbi:hypothetical protein EVAR_57749_1 [Eumeta japonica]|uniref:RNase H type-1 domain-containing protein n=1 Tax=Eumeta variegata TaxID=151549 RepID=A0A4C1ZV50_EUMVA|nr:hypothetical protein EVAR_57749_1 [Eumeta japonica]